MLSHCNHFIQWQIFLGHLLSSFNCAFFKFGKEKSLFCLLLPWHFDHCRNHPYLALLTNQHLPFIVIFSISYFLLSPVFCDFLDSIFMYLASNHHRTNYINCIFLFSVFFFFFSALENEAFILPHKHLFSVFLMLWHLGVLHTWERDCTSQG